MSCLLSFRFFEGVVLLKFVQRVIVTTRSVSAHWDLLTWKPYRIVLYLTKKWKELTNTSFAVLFPLTKWKALAKNRFVFVSLKNEENRQSINCIRVTGKTKNYQKPYCTCNIAKWKELIKMSKVKKNTSFWCLAHCNRDWKAERLKNILWHSVILTIMQLFYLNIVFLGFLLLKRVVLLNFVRVNKK